MQTCHSLSILDSVKSKGESESLGKLLDGMELFTVPPDAAGMLLLELVELIDKSLNHCLGTVSFVVLSGLVQRILKQLS